MSNPARTRGFTLIEMLLVVAIIGIISAIAIPSFLGQRRRARTVAAARTQPRHNVSAQRARRPGSRCGLRGCADLRSGTRRCISGRGRAG